MSDASEGPLIPRRWWRYLFIALGVILLVEIPFAILALYSKIPHHVYWHSDAAGGTSYFHYWDGTQIITQHAQTPIWVFILATILLVLMIAWLAFWVFLTSRWLRRRRASREGALKA